MSQLSFQPNKTRKRKTFNSSAKREQSESLFLRNKSTFSWTSCSNQAEDSSVILHRSLASLSLNCSSFFCLLRSRMWHCWSCEPSGVNLFKEKEKESWGLIQRVERRRSAATMLPDVLVSWLSREFQVGRSRTCLCPLQLETIYWWTLEVQNWAIFVAFYFICFL